MTASVWVAASALVLVTRATGLGAPELGAGEVSRLEESGRLWQLSASSGYSFGHCSALDNTHGEIKSF